MIDEINYEILEDGTCSYCGQNADYAEDSLGKGRLFCSGCDSYNDALEMGLEDGEFIIIPTGDNNLLVITI